MKTVLIVISLLCFSALMLWAAQGNGQEMSSIIVSRNGVNNHVVILQITKAGKAYDLQCNEGASACTQLKNGTYEMLELPKNFGIYDCKDAEVYSNESPEKRAKLGEYCLAER